jgi:hypothetical protein
MPCHQALADALHAYIAAAGAEDRKGWLFRSYPGHAATALTESETASAPPVSRRWKKSMKSPGDISRAGGIRRR